MMKFINIFKQFFSLQVYHDLVNYKMWIDAIKEEKNNPESKYNSFDFSHNFFYIIYTVISLKPEEKALPEKLKKFQVMEIISPINRYLDEELGFADYLIPEINNFFDDENNPTLNYGIMYNFGFKRLSLNWVIKRIILIIGMILGYFNWDSILSIFI